MPKGLDLHELEDCRYGCAPGPAPALRVPARVSIRGVQPNADPTDGAAYVTRQPPQILLRTTPEWRRQCLTEAAHIPSAYTYLGQLMGHDMGSSVALSSGSTSPPNHPTNSAACALCATSQPHPASPTMNCRRSSGHLGSSGR